MEEFPEDSTALISTDFSTTFSATLDSSRSLSNNGRHHLDASRVELEKRQLVHTIQLLKLELSQKQLLLDAARNEQASHLEELQEQLADATHEKRLLSLRLQSLTHGYEQELRKARENQQEERAGRKQVALNSTEAILGIVKTELEEILAIPPVLTKDEQCRLQSTDLSLLAVGEYVRLRFYELTKPLQKQCDDLQRRVSLLNQQNTEKQGELNSSHESLELERERAMKLERQCSNLTMELSSVKTRVQEGNYKMDNFDSVRRERDALRLELEGLQTTLADLDRREKRIKADLDKVTHDLSSTKQSEALLYHDKDYLSRQANEMSHKSTSLEEKLDLVTGELTLAKQAKDKLYHQLLNSKEEQRLEYSHRLGAELDSLREKTTLEMEQLRAQTKEMYDRENKLLSGVKDTAILERDKAISSEKELAQKYESLLKDYHSLQGMSDRHLAELQGELQVVRFEKERNGLVYQEIVKDHRHLQLEQEKLLKKVELLTQEVWSVRRTGEEKVGGLEVQLQEAKLRLEGYEKVEKELDDIVMQSAQMEHSCDAERVLFTYGFGTSVPTNSKRRLQQSVQLARRVLQLEKTNSGLRDQRRWDEERVCRLQEELECSRELLRCSEQPGGYLLERVKEQQAQLQYSRKKLGRVEEEMAALVEEKAALVDTKNRMSADLERLLSHREELQYMKTLLLGGCSVLPPTSLAPDHNNHTSTTLECQLHNSTHPLHSTSHKSHTHHGSSHQTHPPPSPSNQPHPTVFTKRSLASSTLS